MTMCSTAATFTRELAESRGNIYKFLASVYLEKPSETLIGRIVDRSLLDELASIFSESCLSHLRTFADKYSGDIQILHVEYTSLFVAPFGQYVTPYEAVYRDEREVAGKMVKGLLMGESTIDVKRTIRKIGAALDKSYRGLPDHIGLELQIMQFLCEQEARAWAAKESKLALKYLEFEEAFLKDHITTWVPVLTARILDNTRNEFYRGVVRMTREFIEIEKNTFDSASASDLVLCQC